MDGLFIFAIILACLGTLAGVAAVLFPSGTVGYDDVPARKISTVTAVVFGGLALVMTLLSSFTMVSPRTIAISTEFGKPTASFGNGLHAVAPWAEVTEMDGSVQTDNHTGKGAIKARLAHQSIGYVETTVKWRIVAEEADQLFLDYREFEKIRDSLVTRELGAAINAALADVDPLTTEDQPTQDELAASVKSALQEKIGDRIQVISVIIPLVRFDDRTQERIDRLQAAVADTRIANQRKETAGADAAANKILADSVSKDPNVLVARCLDALETLKSLPAGFQCWPGTGGSVVVPSAGQPNG